MQEKFIAETTQIEVPTNFDWDAYAETGDIADVGGLDFSPPVPEPPPKTELQQLTSNRPTIKPPEVLKHIEESTHFTQHHESKAWTVAHDVVGLIKHLPGGHLQTYLEKLAQEREGKKRQEQMSPTERVKESASFGEASLGKQKFMLYEMHWDYFAGSLGVVAVEKFIEAAESAAKDGLPLVSIFTSSGVRQQENAGGVFQMQRMIDAIVEYKEKSHTPYVGVLLGQTWGGVSASAVPESDMLIGVAGTNFGFTGPRVIESYEQKPVPEGAQSVEAHLMKRNIDYLVKNPAELLNYLHDFLAITKASPRKLTETTINRQVPGQRNAVHNVFSFDHGFSPYVPHKKPDAASPPDVNRFFPENIPLDIPKDDYDLYLDIYKNPKRADTEYLLRTIFRDIVPLYSSYIVDTPFGKVHRYPTITAAIGRIGPQNFLIMGNQPSYQLKTDGTIGKIPAGPSPQDFKYADRMLELGKRLRLPALFLTDTLGALPTLDAEENNQSGQISNMLTQTRKYPHPVLSYVIGGMGSGGGLATTPIGDSLGMLKDLSAIWVAEPRSAASILYNSAHPSDEEVKQTAIGLHGSAQYLKELGVIDTLVNSSFGPDQLPTREAIAANLQRSIIEDIIKQQHLSDKHRMEERHRRYREFRGGMEITNQTQESET